MEWREIAVTVSSQGEEAVADLFYQLGCPGVSIDDQELLRQYIESGEWDYHVFGEIIETGNSIVKGYFPVDEELSQKLARIEEGLKQLLEKFPDWVILMTGNSLEEEDWATAWKAFYKPVKIGKHFLIKPSWENVKVTKGELVLELDPGMAFGTGTHPTTTLCLREMEEVIREGHRVYDLGTGSGILAIAAAKLGAEVDAVDLDSVAVKVALENVAMNNVTNRVSVHRGDLGTVLKEKADVVIANIIADVIIALLPDLSRILKDDGEFIASGIIDTRAQEVEEKIKEMGLTVMERREDSGWILLRARWTNSASL